MDKNYILSTLFLTMSCSTATISSTVQTNDALLVCPGQMIDMPVNYDFYLLSSQNSTTYISSPVEEDMSDVEIVMAFAENYFENEVTMDEDIQKVIEEDFWNML